MTPAHIMPIAMPILANAFMTFAWHGHLRFKGSAIASAVVVGRGIAFFDEWLAVPANRIGHSVDSAAPLKTIQGVITLIVFAGFSGLRLKESLT